MSTLRKFLAPLALTLAVALPAQPVLSQDDDEDGGGFLENLIEDNLSSAGREVRIRGFEGALSSRATIAELSISDDEGVWLTLRDAVLDWNRSALLRGRLEVEELSAASIDLPRLPQAGGTQPPPAEAQPFSLPDLPVSVVIETLDIERVALGEPLFGEAAEIALNGSARLAGGEGEAQLAVERLDAEGALTFEGSYANDTGELVLDLSLQEGADGIAANLLDLPGRPSVALSVAGEGPVSDFTADIQLATDGEDRIAGTVSVASEEGEDGTTRSFAADIGGDIAPVFSPQFRPFFGPDIQLEVQGASYPGGRVEIPELSLTAQSLTLQGRIAVGADGLPDVIDVEGRIADQGGAPVLLPVGQDLRVQGVDLDIAFDAARGEDWQALIAIDALDTATADIGDLRLEGTGRIGTTDAGAQTVTADFDFAAEELSLADGGAQAALGDAITGDAAIRWTAGAPVTLDRLALSGDSFELTGEGAVDATGEGTDITLDADLAARDLSAFSALAGRPLSGGAQLSLDLTYGLLQGRFDVALDGTTTDLSLSQPALDRLLAGETTLTLRADRDETGTRVETLSLQSPALQVAGEADLTSQDAFVSLNVDVPDAAALDPRATGAANVDFEATLEQGLWQYTLDAGGLQATVDAEGQITVTEDQPLRIQSQADIAAADLSLFSDLTGRPLAGSVDVAANGYALSDLSAFDIGLDGTLQSVEVGIPQADNLLQGETVLSGSARRDETGIIVPGVTVENPQLTLAGEGRYAEGESRADAQFRLSDAGLLLPELTGAVTADVQAREIAEGWNVVAQAAGLGATVDADVEITELSSDAPRVTGRADVTAEDLARFAPLAGRPLEGAVDLTLDGGARTDLSEFDLAIDGSSADIAIGQDIVDGLMQGRTQIAVTAARAGEQFDLPRLHIENPQIRATGEGSYAPDGGSIDADIDIADAARILPELEGPVTLDLRADAAEEVWTVDLDAEGLGARITADARVSDLRATPRVEGDAQVVAGDLSRLQALAGRPLAGALNLDLSGFAVTDLSAFDLTAEGTARSVEIGQDLVDGLLQGDTDLEIAAARDENGIEVPQFRIANPQISATGGGSYAPGAGAFNADIEVPDAARILPQLEGPVTLTLDAAEEGGAWNVDLSGDGLGAQLAADAVVSDLQGDAAPRVEGTARVVAEDLARFEAIAGRPLSGSLNLTASGAARIDGSDFDVDIEGASRSVEIGQEIADNLLAGATEVDIEARRNDEGVEIPAFRIANPQIRATGEGSYAPGAGAITAELVLADAGDVVQGLSGPLNADLSAEETGGAWSVTLDAEGLATIIEAAVRISEIDTGTPLVDGTVRLTARDLARFRAVAGLPLSGGLQAEARGQMRSDLSRFDVTLDATGTNLGIGQAEVDRILGGQTQIDLSASRDAADAPIRIARAVVDTGLLDVSASGQLGAGGSGVEFDARLTDISPFVDGFSGAVTADGRLAQTGDGYRIDVTATGPGGTDARIAGTAAGDFSTLDLDIDGTAPLALANRFTTPNSLDGSVSFDLALNGAPGLDALSGRVTTSGARAVVPSVSVVLENIGATVTLQNGTARVQAQADKQTGGGLTAQGSIGLSGNLPADLTIDLARFDLTDPNLYETAVNGRVTINGPLAGGATIAGRLSLGQTEVRIPSTGLGATGPIPEDLVHLNEPAEVRATRSRAGLIQEPGEGGSGGGASVAYPLDIEIVADNQIFVRGRGLDAELGGALALTGTTANVIPAGSFELIRGRLDILGQRLTLDEGTITLQGDFTPYIRLVASTDQGDVTVQIVVEGPALEPDIDFLSQPQLPEEEVLARLIFGRSLTSISPLQAAQLASAVATLAGRGGDGVVGNLRQNFGLDDLDVTTDEEGNPAVRAGAYLNENVYTDVTVNAEGQAELNLNLDVTRSLTVRGGVSNEGGTSLGVFFERDY
ncbi:hypothetical protein EKE94_12030 [Mesobaculum littorinae]|uniref:Translocation and assembly module TamB C-terminal domain-containing protein n=1 Tax=Mesobaculum littorinae TaxID=2486419 RepID=A0A438AHM0_9RHOB|nr:translocation/assembly module TamB domain-containing protein [Mesobaculum littorinae]RVV98168.1 hypothetical protein EKE94_12030 [Mesobaculum littorinae]